MNTATDLLSGLDPYDADAKAPRLAEVNDDIEAPAVPVVSVVMPTCNRPQLLFRCLNALLAQRGVPGPFEIIVVDDGRSAKQKAALRDYLRRGGRIKILYVQPPSTSKGPAAARNTGWKMARAPIIAFTDDDTEPTPDWLAEGLRAMKSGVDAAWGHVVVPLSGRPTDSERNTAGLHGAEFVTANCFVRRDALVLVGGFDERFLRPWREDSDLHFSLLEAQCNVIAVPTAVVVHPARRSPPGTSIRQHRNLLFDALLFKKHPQLYRKKISSGPPNHYYATVAAALLALSFALNHAPIFALIAVVVWATLTLRLIGRRLRGTSFAPSNVLDIVFSSFVIPFVAVFWRLAGAIRYRVLFA